MVVQRLYKVGDGFRAAPDGQSDDTLSMTNGDARADLCRVTSWHGVRIDPHQLTGVHWSRKIELLVCLDVKFFSQ